MAEKQIADIMRDFVGSMGERDVEKTLSFFTDDAVWETPMGTFKGKDELRRYLSAETMQNLKTTECGNGIIVEGNKSFFEHVISGTYQGQRGEVLAMCAYEFSDDKIKALRTTFDRLSLAQQTAKGWLPKWLVNFIAKQTEKL